jgi:hypothetical protein
MSHSSPPATLLQIRKWWVSRVDRKLGKGQEHPAGEGFLSLHPRDLRGLLDPLHQRLLMNRCSLSPTLSCLRGTRRPGVPTPEVSIIPTQLP